MPLFRRAASYCWRNRCYAQFRFMRCLLSTFPQRRWLRRTGFVVGFCGAPNQRLEEGTARWLGMRSACRDGLVVWESPTWAGLVLVLRRGASGSEEPTTLDHGRSLCRLFQRRLQLSFRRPRDQMFVKKITRYFERTDG